MVEKAKKKKPAAKKRAVKKTVRDVFVDFPKNGDHIRSGDYAIRIGTKADREVEVSINGKGWNKCRASAGYYWFDWRPEKSGNIRIVARAKNGGTRAVRSLESRCVVDSIKK